MLDVSKYLDIITEFIKYYPSTRPDQPKGILPVEKLLSIVEAVRNNPSIVTKEDDTYNRDIYLIKKQFFTVLLAAGLNVLRWDLVQDAILKDYY